MTETLSLDRCEPPSARVWVGFSGGLDSTVLLHWLKRHLPYGIFLQAVHIHHGLNPAADAWAAHCRTVCEALDVALHIERIRIDDPNRNIEAQAREARYGAFKRMLSEDDTLALAHHADDVAETLLLRLMRGAGTEALANMQRHSRHGDLHIWRPLLSYNRSTLADYAKLHALVWIDDDSNADTGFDRNFLRHSILPLLEQRFPNAGARLAHSAALLQADAALLEPLIASALAACTLPDGLSLPGLLAQPETMQAHILRTWLRNQGRHTPGSPALHEFLRQLQTHADDDATCLHASGYAVRVWQDQLMLDTTAPEVHQDDMEVLWDGVAPLVLPRGGRLHWHGDVPFPVRVRYRRGGERIRLPGQDMHHSVKKLLSTRVPPWRRAALPCVYNEQDELLAVGEVLVSAQLDDLSRRQGTRLHWHSDSE